MDGGHTTLAAGAAAAAEDDDDADDAESFSAHNIKSWVHEILDWIVKLLPVIATLLVAFVANEYKASLTTSTLLSEREKADSQLRSEMFSKLVDPISGSQSDGGVSLDREQLLAELLSLNFHEHINLRPLLNHVDARLAREIKDGDAATVDEMRAARLSFRSVAKAVISRQTAMLTRSDGGANGSALVQKLDIGMPVAEGSPLNGSMKPLFERMTRDKIQRAEFGTGFEAVNPARTHRLHLIVAQPNWASETFQVSVSIFSIDAAGRDIDELAKRDFELSWFDFPLTDNTLLADGTRFAIVLDQVYDARNYFTDGARALANADAVPRVKIGIVWFPRDYIAARERPTNYREFRRSLGLNDR